MFHSIPFITKIVSLFLFLIVFLFHTTVAQGVHQHEHPHENGHEHKHEIGIANTAVYFVKEKAFSYGLHLHYIYNFPSNKFGIGLGYERIFDHHLHNNFGLVASYRPLEPLTLQLSPGIIFEGKDFKERSFGLHLETAYEFEFDYFHLGPVLELAFDKENVHISLGIHLGLGF